MTYAPRPNPMLPPGSAAASLRQPSNVISQQQSFALTARIASKKAELENLVQLRDMSNTLAGQMEALQAKLETLKDGTESIACVLANWDNVLRAITMASTQMTALKGIAENGTGDDAKNRAPSSLPLPATLVRIPETQQDKTSER
ncbi:DASH complex subunit Dad2-domain-containing protein [Aspergillus karnatakaensis]|uniref:DASH complex subunit DAD2 n=1 Tax=Aspergillus karnatakaensis TaxID=1810916 RepID=UPI003CCD2E2D